MWVQNKKSLPDNEIEYLQRLIECQERIVRTLWIKKYLGLYISPYQLIQLTKETEFLDKLYQELNSFEWIEQAN